MTISYCKQYGFDRRTIKRRLQSLELSAADHSTCEYLQNQVIRPGLKDLVEKFYTKLLKQPESASILAGIQDLAPLKTTQTQYLSTFGIGFDQFDYFENRLRVGLAHARFGISLGIYMCAYRMMEQLILDAVPEAIRADQEAYTRLQVLILKLTTLDMSIAAETYHATKIKSMERSLDYMRKEESHLRQLASSDSLTHLLNHEYGLEVLHNTVKECANADLPLCLMMADLDKFKEVNDTHGHLVGDGVLRESAARIKSSVRQHDVVSRYGGEEFMIILSNTNLETAAVIAERIRSHLSDSPIVVDSSRISLTISIGLYCMQDTDDAMSIVKHADEALYTAKKQGRNRVVVQDNEIAGN